MKKLKKKPVKHPRRKAGLKFAEVKVSPFKVWIQIAIGKDVHLVANELAKKCKVECNFQPSPQSQACFSVVPGGDNLWKFITLKPSLHVAEIAHEVFHAVVHLSGPDGRGDAITESSQECWAYTFENLFGNVLLAYKDLGGRIKK
jgi:hypothetical protein